MNQHQLNPRLSRFSNQELTLEVNLRAGKDPANFGKLGNKDDSGKPRMSLVHPLFIRYMAEVLTRGAADYGDKNYMYLTDERVENSLLRHVNAWREGDKSDPKTNHSHLIYIACNAMMAFEKELEANKVLEVETPHESTQAVREDLPPDGTEESSEWRVQATGTTSELP